MKEFPKSQNGITWAQVADEARGIYPQVINMISTEKIISIGGHAQTAIHRAIEGEASGACVAIPADITRLLCYFASSAICEELARREKVHNETAARVASQ